MLTRRSFACKLAAAVTAAAGHPFPLRRGTNISHWLSQSRGRCAVRQEYFQRKDVAGLASIGLDHLRLKAPGLAKLAKDAAV